MEQILGHKIHPAPDEWDRLFNIDFYIQIGDAYIGLQIKPAHQGIQLTQIHKEKDIQAKTHKKWSKKYRGRVFYVYSKADTNNKKTIMNEEVIEEIRAEIKRLG